ncbi:MAG: GTP cyclohydrolase I FolE [Planctomycetaceae bacterium]|nr:GTP cyclohydrolase I FolE [Planctomycetota bacterium]NUN52784.1 GTP cyclohydrolase I FolE [Planctomycetaceae bacterium]
MAKTARKAEPAEQPALQPLVEDLLLRLGEDPARPGLLSTPKRVERSLRFLTSGYRVNMETLLNGAVFEDPCDEMVVVKDIELYSMCEHHMLPFFGKCHIGYIPRGRIVGLSKLPRIVDAFARRLQVQERLTTQIAQAIDAAIKPRGVAVVIEARHLCMMMRGVEKQNSSAVTSCMLGGFKSDNRTRGEFLAFIGN